MDKLLQKYQMSLQEDLNVEADKLADTALKKAVRGDSSIRPDLPGEQIKVVDKETGHKAVGSITNALSKWTGRRMYRHLFANRKRMGSKIQWNQYDNIC